MTAEPRPLIGAHLRTGGGLEMVPVRAVEIGAEAAQIFPTSPRRWQPHRYSDAQIHALGQGLSSGGIPLFIHSIYLINLASPDDLVHGKSVAALAHALLFGARTGARGVVTHVGSHKGTSFENGLERTLTAVEAARALAAEQASQPLPPLLLESSAGAPNSLGRTIEELGILVRELGEGTGICLDSAHLFAAGYPIHQEAGLEALLETVEAEVGLKQLGVFHLNDSLFELGAGRDQHANLGDGYLGYEGIGRLLRHPNLRDVPFVMEIPGLEGHGPDLANVDRAKRMREG